MLIGNRQFEPERAVEVIAPKYGSAYRIGARLVLTAAHLVAEVGSDCRVRAKQHFAEVEAKVVWKAEQADIALVELPETIKPYEAVVFGSLPEGRNGEKLEFKMYGWPKWAQTKREQGQLAAGGRQIEGLIYLADKSPDNFLVIEAKRLPPEGLSGSRSEWEGASGAAVVCDGLVIAVQMQHQNPKRPASLEATPLWTIYEDEQWCDLLKQHAINPEPAIARLRAEKRPLNESSPAKKTILVIAFGSIAQPRQQMCDEVITIKAALEQSLHRDKFDVKEKFVASYEDLQKEDLEKYLIESRPWIVHIIEHREAKTEELALDNEKDGETQLAKMDILINFLNVVADECLKCVILYSDYSELHAKLINLHIKYVIAIEPAITNNTKRFLTGFYTQLGEDFLLEKAYRAGCKSVKLAGQSKNSQPLFLLQKSTREQRENYTLEAQKILYASYTDWNKETNSTYRSFNNSYKEPLDELRKQHELLPEEAIAINNLILEKWNQEGKKFSKYEQKLKELFERYGELNYESRNELSTHQEFWDISDNLAGRAYNNLAMCLYDKDKVKAAVALFKESIDFHKDDPVAYLNLGYILYQEGERIEGINNLRTAKKLYQNMKMSDYAKEIEQDIKTFEINNKINSNIIRKILRWLVRG